MTDDTENPQEGPLEVRPGPGGTVDVVAAVAAVMGELPAIGKDAKADPKMGGYSYRGIEAITRHVQPLLAKRGVIIVPRAEVLTIVPSPGMKEGWQDLTLRVEWTIAASDGSTITAATTGVGRDNADKGANKAQTQAMKYLLLALLCISDAKDDGDGHNIEHGRAQAPPPEPRPEPPEGRMWVNDAGQQILAHVEGDKERARAIWDEAALEVTDGHVDADAAGDLIARTAAAVVNGNGAAS